MIARTDKKTGEIEVFSTGDSAIKQYQADFGIRTARTAKIHLFDLLMGKYPMIQNVKVAWAKH